MKNAVIVPVGSKGGFVLKRPPADRAALAEEGLACYREFISALLELTDNYVEEGADAAAADGAPAGAGIAPPPDTVRHDGDDPYLVVAADKGTATFSDPANALSAAAGFWLGDAFASGGSDGYDHKGIGITARGAWESVKSHFRALGLDPRRGAVHGRRHRRHERRRLRQRRAPLAPHPTRRRVQPPPRLRRPRPGPRDVVRGARAPLPPAALDLGRLPRGPHLGGGRGVAAEREVDRPLRGGDGRPRRPGRGARRPHPERRHPGHPPRPRGPPVERGHRHLRQGRVADPRGGRRPLERRGPDQRPRAAVPGGGGGRQPRLHPGRARRVRARRRPRQHRRHRQLGRGSTAPTTRSTSRSSSTRRCGPGSSTRGSEARSCTR